MHSVPKYLVLVLVVGLMVVADQWTKRWAADSLAAYNHPLSIVVTEAEAGQSLEALVAGRFPDLAEDAAEVVQRYVQETVAAPAPLDPAASPFSSLPTEHGARTPAAYHVYPDGDLSRSPRVVRTSIKVLVERWLHFVLSDRPREETRALATSAFADIRLDDFLAERVPGLDKHEVVVALEAGHVVPVQRGLGSLTADRVVRAGERYLLYDRTIDVIPGFWRYEYKENPGAAWGILGTASPMFRRAFLAGVSILASLAVLVIFVRLGRDHWSAIFAFSFILSGAVGNLIDRLQTGLVIDFVDWYVKGAHWPTFNVADIGISVGVAALVIEMLFVKSSPFAAHKEKKA